MYHWMSKDYILDEMTLEQCIFYYYSGWDFLKIKNIIFVGILGMALSGEGQDPGQGQGMGQGKQGIIGLSEFKKIHKDGIVENGVWKLKK